MFVWQVQPRDSCLEKFLGNLLRLSKNKLLGAEPTCWSLGGSESGPSWSTRQCVSRPSPGLWASAGRPIRGSDFPEWQEAGCSKGRVLLWKKGGQRPESE